MVLKKGFILLGAMDVLRNSHLPIQTKYLVSSGNNLSATGIIN